MLLSFIMPVLHFMKREWELCLGTKKNQHAGISPGALYRYFESKDQLIVECFTYVDKQAAAIFEHLRFNPLTMVSDPMGAVKSLWLPYFRFWVAHPDETVFYHRFRDSAFFPEYDKERDISYFDKFIRIVRLFKKVFPALNVSTTIYCGSMFLRARSCMPNT